MKKQCIGVMDSGVGGLSVLYELTKALPNENFIYLGDNHNAPYGDKSNRELAWLCFNSLVYLSSYNVKAVVIACNTLSCTVLNEMKPLFDFEIYGVYPPTLTPVINEEKTLMISTPQTARNTINIKGLKILQLPNLAREIERSLYHLKDINLTKCIGEDVRGFDTVILGCTHYELIKNQIFNHFQPRKIISGTNLTVNEVLRKYINKKSSVKINKNEVFFIGKSRKINEDFWKKVVVGGLF